MAKKVIKKIKLQIKGGQATAAPPVGPALGQCGLNIQEFCTKFNERTRDKMGDIIPTEISVYEDRTYTFVTKTPPASVLINKIGNFKKGSANALLQKVRSITDAQLTEIAQIKLEDLNTSDIEQAKKIIAGTARQMGVEIV
ncbi:MAG: 50S ribosomal protein L11 [Candidatus Falkowbacteria bacterium]|nr:50S ribosomal protein L11 [Candidatus Falkowbacteria bacterium]